MYARGGLAGLGAGAGSRRRLRRRCGLAAMVTFALAAWLWTASRNAGPRGRGIGAFATLLVLLATLASACDLAARVARAAPLRAPTTAAFRTKPIPPRGSMRCAQQPSGVRRRHRGLVHHLSGQRDASHSRATRCAKRSRSNRRLSGRRLDQPRSGNHHAARSAWPLRRAALSLLCAGRADAKVLPQILTEGEVLKAVARVNYGATFAPSKSCDYVRADAASIALPPANGNAIIGSSGSMFRGLHTGVAQRHERI